MNMARSRTCGWKVGSRTACPVLIDNLSEEEVDIIWAEVSRINWALREKADPVVSHQISDRQLQNAKRRSLKGLEA